MPNRIFQNEEKIELKMSPVTKSVIGIILGIAILILGGWMLTTGHFGFATSANDVGILFLPMILFLFMAAGALWLLFSINSLISFIISKSKNKK